MEEELVFLKNKAQKMRQEIITMIYKAQSGHPGGSLSSTDIMVALYFSELNIDPTNPQWKLRDRMILSKGHCCPVLYTALAMRGYFDMEILGTLRQMGSILQGHPYMNKVPGIDMTTGSLGQGLSVGVGMAIGAKADDLPSRIFVLIGDGECNEGQIWEAAMCAAKYKLNNLIAIIDQNGLQNDGFTREIMPTESLADKWNAFGWQVLSIDGHNMTDILKAFKTAKQIHDKPVCIIAKTVKGKGVSFMENVPVWHGKAPNSEEYMIAMQELKEGIV